jgi:ABC-2 type transport system ATP-binding protein
MEVEVKNLTRDFGKTRAVDELSFAFGSGSIYGFVGPNGAGKTTTMRILATLDEPSHGDAWIDQHSVIEQPEWARRRIGFMPDALPAHRDMSVAEYLDFFARAYGLRGKQRRQTMQQVEGFTNLEGLRDKSIRALSKGMKQRVSLARALVHDPPLLVMDEPAAGLDPRARVELRELLKALADQGKAILISSHILTELAEICDGAVIIEQGRLVTAGTMDQIYHGGGEANKRAIAVRTRSNQDSLHKTLLEMPAVEQARLSGDHVEAEVLGDEETCCDVLEHLLKQNYRILEFKQVKADLEHIFMSQTQGDVQ